MIDLIYKYYINSYKQLCKLRSPYPIENAVISMWIESFSLIWFLIDKIVGIWVKLNIKTEITLSFIISAIFMGLMFFRKKQYKEIIKENVRFFLVEKIIFFLITIVLYINLWYLVSNKMGWF